MKMTRILLIILPLIIFSCTSGNMKKSANQEDQLNLNEDVDMDEELVEDFNKAKQIFYALPSPVEIAMLIKRAGTEFNHSLINSDTKSSNYTSLHSKALNFGVYGADLSYASLFEQSQEAMKLVAVSEKLANEIGILEFLNADIVERMEKNINNRDSTMEIITEIFMTSNDYLKESGQPNIAAIIIAGGWIEGLFIATQLAKESPYNNELIDRIIDQKVSLATLISLLESFEDKVYIKQTLADVLIIQKIYNKVQIVTSKVEPLTDHESKITTLQAKTEIFIADDIFNQLCYTVDSIRSNIVNL